MEKIKKIILVVIMIMAVTIPFTTNYVSATAGIMQELDKTRQEALEDADSGTYTSIKGFIDDFNKQTSTTGKKSALNSIKTNLDKIKNKSSEKYKEYQNEYDNLSYKLIDTLSTQFKNETNTTKKGQIKNEIRGILNSIYDKNSQNFQNYSNTYRNEIATAIDYREHGTTSGGHTVPNTSVDPIENPDKYKPSDTNASSTKLKDMANDLIGALRAVGTIAAVVLLMFMGYKFMIGSASDRADYKSSMIPYLIGAILLYTIPTLLGIGYDLVKGIKF